MTYIRWTFPVILFPRYNPYCNVPRRCFILVFLFDSSEVPSLHVPPRASYFHYSRLFSPLLFSLRLVTHHLSRVPRPRCRCRCCSIPSCSLVASPFLSPRKHFKRCSLAERSACFLWSRRRDGFCVSRGYF